MADLIEEQKVVFNKYIAGENIFITGPGGVGKTHLIRAIAEHAIKNEKKYKVCALTGCAAILLMCKATTIHSFAGIGIATEAIDKIVEKVIKSRHKRVNWHKTDILIVDEVSMLSLKIFKILDMIARKIKKQPNIPFGGMQIIFSGDFYQLPPVPNEQDPDTAKFCFETPLWNETFLPQNQIQLKTIFRQTDDKYIKILNKIRVGKITNSMINTLTECVDKEYIDKDKPTLLFPRRRDADIVNNAELNKLDKETEKLFKVARVSESDLLLTKEQERDNMLFTLREKEYEINSLVESIMPEREIKLRIGTKVMCTMNLNMEGENPLINGSQGIVTDFTEKGNPMIEFYDGQKQVIGPHTWISPKMPGIAIKQLPLIYAWAITIHKAQGLTLNKALIDLGSGIFESGQTYVALSRVKSLEGLYLTAFDYRKIRVNIKVQQFYEQLEKLID